MIRWKRGIGLGLASWAIPFVISFAVFSLKRNNAPLFQTLMSLVELATAGAMFALYFRGRRLEPREALWTGLMWTAINLALDYPMFNFGPMKMSVGEYYSEIGLAYLVFPLFGISAASLAPTQRVSRA